MHRESLVFRVFGWTSAGFAMADLQNEMADLGLGTPRPLLGMSASFKGESRSKKKGQHLRSRSGAEELINLLHGSDPVKLELNRLENEVRGCR